ncbi:hypothetical protein FACS189485_19830 [Spirochaetia bacterium]|nr:hypothetical protein FACS189485_19830 [Spirochaetia bacterium]
MNRKLAFLAGLIVICTGLNAQETNLEQSKKFFFGVGWSNLQRTGDFLGSFDFSFLLYENPNKEFGIRNSILFDGGSYKDNGNEHSLFSLSEKISFEKITSNSLFRYYAFLQGGIGIYGNKTKGYFENPFAYNFGVGIGLDIFVEKNASIFFDYAFLYNILDNKFYGDKYDPKFQMGIRYYF